MELQNMYLIFNMFHPVLILFIHLYILYMHSLRVNGRLFHITAQTEEGRETFRQSHTCRQFVALSSPELHLCGREESGST